MVVSVTSLDDDDDDDDDAPVAVESIRVNIVSRSSRPLVTYRRRRRLSLYFFCPDLVMGANSVGAASSSRLIDWPLALCIAIPIVSAASGAAVAVLHGHPSRYQGSERTDLFV